MEKTIERALEITMTEGMRSLFNKKFFEPDTPYPKKPSKKICECCGSKVEDKEALNDYEIFKKKYFEEKKELDKLFREFFFQYLGIEDNPKKNILFVKAWERGHSSGLYEVINCGENLIELIE